MKWGPPCGAQAVEALLQGALPVRGGCSARSARSMSFADFRRLFLLLPQTDMLVDYWLRAACPGACDIGSCVTVREATSTAKVSC